MSMPATKPTTAFADAARSGRVPYKVADLSLAEFGRREMRLAEQEMPGLMALRAALSGPEAARAAPRSWAACT